MNSGFVVDASVCLTWLLKERRTEAAKALLSRTLYEEVLTVPHFYAEVGNGLLSLYRRGKLDLDELRLLTEDVRRFRLKVVPVSPSLALEEALAFGLASYDAAYLALARGSGFGLATLDRKLREAAEKAGVLVL